jgi:hypothetical protein
MKKNARRNIKESEERAILVVNWMDGYKGKGGWFISRCWLSSKVVELFIFLNSET